MDFSPVAVIGGSLAVIGGLLYSIEPLHRRTILEILNKNSLLAELGKLILLRAVSKEKFAAQLSISITMC